jgi:hypothetical protein
MLVKFDTRAFDQKMSQFVDYSIGFIEGVESGKSDFMKEFGRGIIAGLSQWMDSHARSNPQALHHVYEWYRTGSPEARLFNITSSANAGGIQITSTFRQSKTLQKDAKEPFYNKAQVMESGQPITIKPKKDLLVFNINGEPVFTRKEVTVVSPGGRQVAKSYEKTFDEFFQNYFTQSFLKASGLLNYLEDVSVYKTNLKNGGKSVGKQTGYRWILNAKVGVE